MAPENVPAAVFFRTVEFIANVSRYAAAAWVIQAVLGALAGSTAGDVGGGAGGGVGLEAEGMGGGVELGEDGAGVAAAASLRWVMVTLPFGQAVKDAWRAVLGLFAVMLAKVPAEWAQGAAEVS